MKNIIKEIENIFYSKIRKSYLINEDKKWRIEYIREMNKNYLENFNKLRIFDENINYFRFYELSINKELIREKEKLDYKLEKLEEKIEEKKRMEREKEEREEIEEIEEREWEENRRRKRIEKEEREENRKREEKEEREKRRPVYLLICYSGHCADKCLFCGRKISETSKRSRYAGKVSYYYRAHGSCIPNNNDKKCVICHKNKGTSRCNNQCFVCFEQRNKMEEKCYYCKESLRFWDK
jgi:hypothetical protein